MTLRNKARDEYLTAKKELEQGIAGLSTALSTLQNATENATEGVFASIGTELARVVNVDHRFLSQKDVDAALRSIQAPGGADWEKLNADPEFAMKYKARSSEIQNVLSDMLDAFKANLNNTEAVETKAVADFDALMGAKNGQLDTAKNALLDKSEETGAHATALSDSKEEKTDKEEQNTRDEGFVSATKTACDTKADEWAARKKLRNEEIIAISEAIQIIHSDDARDLFKKSFDKVTPSAFIQVAKKSYNIAGAVKILQKHARGKRGARVAALITRIMTEKKKKKKMDPFQAVIDEVTAMIDDLVKEEDADFAEKTQCETDQMSNTQSAKTDSKSIDSNTEEIDRLNAKIEKAEEGIASNKQQIEDLETAKEEATTQREKEEKEYAQAKLDDQGAIDLLESSMGVLKDFYEEKGLSLGLVQKGAAVRKATQEPFVAAGEAPEEAPATWDSEYGGASGETAGILGLT